MSVRTAACSCGQLRAICEGAPLRVSLCHCLECQKRTGSLFSVAARFTPEHVTIEGRSTKYRRGSDDGNWVDFHFCPVCGSTVWWELEVQPGVIAVAVGAFADPDFPMPARSVYQNRRHSWLELPEKIDGFEARFCLSGAASRVRQRTISSSNAGGAVFGGTWGARPKNRPNDSGTSHE